MKQLLMIGGLVLTSLSLPAQETVRTEEYCEFTLAAGPLGSGGRCAIRLDMGQTPAPWPIGVRRLRDERNELILFNSAVDALNYLNGYGWKLVEVRSSDEETYYLMCRTVRDWEGTVPQPDTSG